MGLSVSAASVVLAIGFTLVAIVLVDSFTGSYEELDEASEDRTDRQRRLLDTRIEIESVQHLASAQELKINVTNNGSTTLDPLGIDVLVDGILRNDNITFVGVGGNPAQAWFPEKTLEVVLSMPGPPQRVKVVTDNGVADYTENIQSLP